LSIPCEWTRLFCAMGCFCSKVTKYTGFKEHAYRLLFPYEDNFQTEVPHLLTILPSGLIENDKKLVAEKEKGLIAYTYAQVVEANVAKKVIETDKPDSAWKDKPYNDTPFVNKSGDKYMLVQTWPTKINDKFKQDFEMTDHNPNLKHFENAAVNEFKSCIETLFGKDATQKVGIKYCHKVTENKFPCYLGKTEALLEYLKDDVAAMKEVGIKEVMSDGLGFVAIGEDGKGKPVEKPFTMEPNTKYVIYKKVGWETMGCCKTKQQFDKEAEFFEKEKF